MDSSWTPGSTWIHSAESTSEATPDAASPRTRSDPPRQRGPCCRLREPPRRTDGV